MPARANADDADPGSSPVDLTPPEERSTAQLIADFPRLIVALIRDELQALKNELVARLALAGVGVGLMAGAAFVAFFALAVFVAAAIIALSLVLPGWLAALLVVVGLLVITALLVLIGAQTLKKRSTGSDEKAATAPGAPSGPSVSSVSQPARRTTR